MDIISLRRLQSITDMKRILAKCLKTYADEDDMQRYCDGEIEPCDVKIYYKGKKYKVDPRHYDKNYYELISDKS